MDVVGDDKGGRKIIVVSACKLPPNKNFDNQRFLRLIPILMREEMIKMSRYLMLTLDQYVDIDYSLVYFHHGLNSSNKPPLSWLWGLYKVVDRRYKKNLKTCFIVHPTSFIRVVYNFFKPIIRYEERKNYNGICDILTILKNFSAKFGRKIQYVNQLSELKQHMNINALPIPTTVREYDKRQNRCVNCTR